ncbi:MAG: tripartite tricarboxylate transporter substrate binding protein, partial [Alphaproteobacteria bacterium]
MFRRIALTLIALCLPVLALAQGWVPELTVRIILPFPPGGSTDLVGRILADRVSRSAPHPWVVENRSGANG